MALATFYTKHRGNILKTLYVSLLVVSLSTIKSSGAAEPKSPKTTDASGKEIEPKEVSDVAKIEKLHKNNFLKKVILKDKKTLGIFLVQCALLFARTVLSLKVANLDGLLVSSLVKKKVSVFLKLLLQWLLLGIPSSLLNASLDFTTNYLSLNINKLVTTHLLSTYLNKDLSYYTMINMYNLNPIQYITKDVDIFSSNLANLLNQLLKPILDLILCSFELLKSGSGEGTLLLGIIVHFSNLLLKLLQPNFTKLTIDRSHLESVFRHLHSRIATRNEEIAILRGEGVELDILDKAFYSLTSFINTELRSRAIYNFATNFVVKYTWGAAGLVLCSIPTFFNQTDESVDITANFITNRRLLLTASSSLGRLVQLKKNIAQLTGLSTRLLEFNDILTRISTDSFELSKSDAKLVTDDKVIEFKEVPLITPTNNTLVESLSFKLPHGSHLLIIGPNGCGKSSLFRILGGLWPVRLGELHLPSKENIFYLPQKSYLSKSTFREQLIYPTTLKEYQESEYPEEKLLSILKTLELDSVLQDNIAFELIANPDREVSDIDPLSTVRNWTEEISIGVQQRLAMARLYYHAPKFAVLDECTSAVSPAMEQKMYAHAQHLGISLISVCHRTSLWHFHDHLLKFDGKGGYTFGRFDPIERLNMENELQKLNTNLSGVTVQEKRLKELKVARDSNVLKRTMSQRELTKTLQKTPVR